jgi:hypothetical protein
VSGEGNRAVHVSTNTMFINELHKGSIFLDQAVIEEIFNDYRD